MNKFIIATNAAICNRMIVNRVAQGKKVPQRIYPYPFQHGLEETAQKISQRSGNYSKNPIKKLISFFKEFRASLNFQNSIK